MVTIKIPEGKEITSPIMNFDKIGLQPISFKLNKDGFFKEESEGESSSSISKQ